MQSTSYYIPWIQGDTAAAVLASCWQAEGVRLAILARWLLGIVPVAVTVDEINDTGARITVHDNDGGVIPDATEAEQANAIVLGQQYMTEPQTAPGSGLVDYYNLRTGAVIGPAGPLPANTVPYWCFAVGLAQGGSTGRRLVLMVANPLAFPAP